MSGAEIAKIIDDELRRRGMTQYEFCKAIGIQSSAMSAWRNGSMPKPQRLLQIEEFLGISFSDYGKEDETEQFREMLRDRQSLRVLLNSAKDVPDSSVYALVSQLEKMKEDKA